MDSWSADELDDSLLLENQRLKAAGSGKKVCSLLGCAKVVGSGSSGTICSGACVHGRERALVTASYENTSQRPRGVTAEPVAGARTAVSRDCVH